MKIGDMVVRKSYDKDITFKVIDIKEEQGIKIYILKGINIRIIADSDGEDLEEVREDYCGEKDKILNSRVNKAIKTAISMRDVNARKGSTKEVKSMKSQKDSKIEELFFGRPGKILHVDGDKDYMDTCLKVYKQLSLDAVGVSIAEEDQPQRIVDLVKETKPDIVVLTGHDSVVKEDRKSVV